jgi:predicted transcriptional regulator
MTTTAIHPTTIKIDPVTKARIQRLADARQRTTHWMILDAVRQYVDHEEKREAFRQAGIQAWDDYQATGLHVRTEEADAWLAQLEAGDDAGFYAFKNEAFDSAWSKPAGRAASGTAI